MDTLNRYKAFGKYGIACLTGTWYRAKEVDTFIKIQNGKIAALQATIVQLEDYDIFLKDNQIKALTKLQEDQLADIANLRRGNKTLLVCNMILGVIAIVGAIILGVQ